MTPELFKEKILNTIEKCSHDFYWIKLDKSIKCRCTEHATKQPNDECSNCLGTGYKIIIKNCRGAINEEMLGSTRINNEMSNIIRNYFIDSKYDINEDDLFIDNNEIYYVFRYTDMYSLNGLETHKEVICSKISSNHDIKLSNFFEIIKEYNQKS